MTAMDLFSLLFILLIKHSGTQDVSTVKTISVQKGQSIIIPCLYRQDYPNQILSAGCYRLTNTALYEHPYNPKPVFLFNDKAHNIFTVRMDHVQESGDYLCALHTSFRPDKQAKFSLEVTTGPSSLHVSNQNLTGSEGDSLTVTCYHYGQADVTWCKFGGSCMKGTTGTLEGVSVQIKYYWAHMMVTMSKLKKENSGWYYCSSRDLQMPVHVTVKQNRNITTTELPQITTTSRNRTAILFLLTVILEVFLVIIIYTAQKLFKLCRERCLQSTKQEAEESQYVIMHRKQSSHSHRCAAVGEGTYERMTTPKSASEPLATSYKSTHPAEVNLSYLPNMPQGEPDYVNVIKT